MWISIFAASLAIALILCIAAIMIASDSNSTEPKHALLARAPEPPPTTPFQSPQLPAHEYGEGKNILRPVSSSLAQHLQWHYLPTVNEPIPDHLMALARRLGN